MFPYRVVCFLDIDELVILAYAHERLRAGYWMHRLDA